MLLNGVVSIAIGLICCLLKTLIGLWPEMPHYLCFVLGSLSAAATMLLIDLIVRLFGDR